MTQQGDVVGVLLANFEGVEDVKQVCSDHARARFVVPIALFGRAAGCCVGVGRVRDRQPERYSTTDCRVSFSSSLVVVFCVSHFFVFLIV